jgi:hypothetical protein
MVRWKSSAQTNIMTISGAATGSTQNLRLSISKLIYTIDKISLDPFLFAGLKNVNFFGFEIPLSDWIPRLEIPLPRIYLPGFNLVSGYKYSTSGPKVLTSASYNFAMNVKEISVREGQKLDATVNTLDHVYHVTLYSAEGRDDTIHFNIPDLPSGYSFKFFPNYAQLDSNGPKTVALVVYSPDQVLESPGTINFNIVATSKTKKDYKLSNPSITKSVPLTIPEIVNFEFNPVNDWSDPAQVNSNDIIPVEFYVKNLGNVEDTVNIDATLYASDQNHSWSNTLVVSRNAIENGAFTFKFALDDVYPFPGLYRMVIQATSQKTPTLSKKHILYFNFTNSYGVEASITPENTTINANQRAEFLLTMKNVGNTFDNFSLMIDAPPLLAQYLTDLTYPQKISDLSSMQSEEVAITFRLSNAVNVIADLYEFRVSVISEGDNSAFASLIFQVNILPAETEPPALTYHGPFNTSATLVFPRSPLDLGLTWSAYDANPGTYDIYINGALFDSNSWINDDPIFVPVTGINDLAEGLYNVTIVFNDGANYVVDQKWVTIVPTDTVLPSILPTTETITLPVNYINRQEIKWNCTEEFLLNITVYLNDVELPYTDYSIERNLNSSTNWLTKLIIDPTDLSQGIWNYTLVIQDMSNNIGKSEILINITAPDVSLPSITQYPATTKNQNHGETISIVATDEAPERFELYVNSSLEENRTWISNTPIIIDVDKLNLTLGPNDLEIYIFDQAGNYNYYKWTLTLEDIDDPIFLSTPNVETTVEEHTLSRYNAPFWEVYDLHPGTYSIYRDSSLIEEGNWHLGNNTIRFPVNDLTAGRYNYEAYFTDSSGNTLYSSINLTVEDVVDPFIYSLDPIIFEPLYVADWFEFFILEKHPNTFDLFRNNTNIGSGTVTADFLTVLTDIGDLATGTYNFSLMVYDESGNVGERSVLVKVTDFTPPLITRPSDIIYSEGKTGNILYWEIQELNPKNYSIYLNDEQIETGTLTTNLTLSVDNLDIGVHEYVLIVYDHAGLSHTSISYVLVADITKPELNHIADLYIVAGDENAELTWQPSDLHPATYIIQRNGINLIQDDWDGNEITFHVVGWSTGVHTVQLIVRDDSDNEATDTIKIIIYDEQSTTTFSEIEIGDTGISIIYVLLSIPVLGLFFRSKKRKK